jgi:hypothetical protein
MHYQRKPPTVSQNPVSVQEAAAQAPTLARLSALALESRERLAAVAPLLTPAMRSAVQAGPIEADQWCLLANNSAVAAKLRQLQPSLLAALQARGWQVNAIRIKVQAR